MEPKRRWLVFLADENMEWQASSGHDSAEDAQAMLGMMMRHHSPEFAQRYRIEGVVVESTVEGAFVGAGPIKEPEEQSDAQDSITF